MSFFLLVIAVALLGVTGDVLINQWAKTQLVRWLALSIPVWIAAAVFFGVVLRVERYSFGMTVVVILVFHSAIAMGWDVLFEGTVLTPTQWVGVVVAIVAIVLIEIGRR